MILYIKHIDIEGPGTIGGYFEQHGFSSKTIEMGPDASLPDDLSDIEAVITLGGPMNVYEEDQHPFLKMENEFLKAAIDQKIPVLGICLGSQLIAKASGAKVTKSPIKEIGWSMVRLTDEGKTDPLFEGISEFMAVFQWHEDTFDIPKGGQLLSTSQGCPHQAFKIHPHAYGLQFHIEVDEDIIASWIRKYWKVDDAQSHPEGQKILEQYHQLKEKFDLQAQVVYKNFADIVRTAKGNEAIEQC